MTEKTLCNLSNGIVAVCDGACFEFAKQERLCSGALEATHRSGCAHLCEPNNRCDSLIAQDLAMQELKK